MAIYTFWADSFTPTPAVGSAVPSNCGMAFTSTVSGNVTAIQFWKVPSDTGVHVGTVYRESDQAVIGSVTFSGETASGWQTAVLTPAVAITAGSRYRVAVSRSVAWADSGIGGFTGLTVGPLTVDANSRYALSSAGYPATANSNHTFYVDILFDDLVATDARVTQVAAETWMSGVPDARVTQSAAEIWVRHIPVTAVVVSQALAEVWVPSPPPPAPPWRRQSLSSQAP
jgi:hypothetical protein